LASGWHLLGIGLASHRAKPHWLVFITVAITPPRPESRRQWESRGQGRMPQGSRGDVPPQARSHVHCDVFG